jgi:predicted branched-subunit amino acid permease
MFWQSHVRKHPEFKVGMHDFGPQALGIVAWGLMIGVAMVNSGMGTLPAVLMALLVFAGSSQLAAIPLIVAGAPAWVILATAFCVNLRFVVFSLHMRPFLIHLPRWTRLAVGYFITDNGYVLFTKRFHVPGRTEEERLAHVAYLAGANSLNWASWMLSSLVGIALAHSIPSAWGLGFAGILCLLGVQCSLASSRLRIFAAVVAGITAVLVYSLPLRLNIVTAIAVAVVLCMTAERFKPVASPGGHA